MLPYLLCRPGVQVHELLAAAAAGSPALRPDIEGIVLYLGAPLEELVVAAQVFALRMQACGKLCFARYWRVSCPSLRYGHGHLR